MRITFKIIAYITYQTCFLHLSMVFVAGGVSQPSQHPSSRRLLWRGEPQSGAAGALRQHGGESAGQPYVSSEEQNTVHCALI